MAVYDLTVSIPSSVATGDILNCPYSGTYKSITLPAGVFQLECWGAQGGDNLSSGYAYQYAGGKGGYTKGTLTLTSSTVVYLYSGGKGVYSTSYGSAASGGFNGGGNTGTCGGTNAYTYGNGGSGGGASDIRIGSNSLYARAAVAGGGAGSFSGSNNNANDTTGVTNYSNHSYQGGYGGGSVAGGGGSWCCDGGNPGTATGCPQWTTYCPNGTYAAAGSFGQGSSGASGSSYAAGTGAGGGWYGGQGGGSGCGAATGGGGSGYVYTSATASQYPSGGLLNSTYYLADSVNVGGNTSFTDYSGSTVTGHVGNGATRITVLSAGTSLSDTTTPAIKKTSVTLSASVTFSNGDTFTDCGFCCSQTNATPTTADSKLSLGAKSTDGAITGDLTAFSYTKYYIRAYGILPNTTVKYSNVLTYTHVVIPTGAITSNRDISTTLSNLVKGKTYYIRPYGVKQDNSVVNGNVTTYVHDYLSVGNISIFKSYSDKTLSTSSVSDILIGNSFVYHVVGAMNTVYCYNKNADGTLGSYISSYNWYNADSAINAICRSGSSVPSAYALYVKNSVDYLVGWSMDSAILYEWIIDATTHLPTSRQQYSVCAQACNSYSRGGWGGKNYVYFLNRGTWGIYRWDLNNKSSALVQLGTIPANSLDSSYTGSGLFVNEDKSEVYYGDGSNESQGLLGAFNYKTGTQVTIITGSNLNTFGVPSISGDNGNISISALHPNIAYYFYFSTSTIRYLTVDLGTNRTPGAPILSSPTSSGYTINKRPSLVINTPYDADGDVVQVKATIKSGSTVLETKISELLASDFKNLVSNPELKDTSWWSGASTASSSLSGGMCSFTCGSQWGHYGATDPFTCSVGDKLYYRAWVKNPYSTLDLCRIGLGALSTGSNVWTTASCPVSSTFQRTSAVVTSAQATNYFAVYDTSLSGFAQIQFYSPIVLNLTKIFGTGKEPTQGWCDANVNMLVNLLPDSSFENGGSGWSSPNIITYLSPYGVKCLKNATVSAFAHYTTSSRPVAFPNHKYYFRSAQKVVTHAGGGAGWVFAEIGFYNSGGSAISWSAWVPATQTATDWVIGSSLTTAPANTASIYPVLLDHDTAATTLEAYADGALLIDLTMTYGEGNEPTQDWCDANIPYFDGTYYANSTSVLITNLLPNGSFENSTTNYSGYQAAISSDNTQYQNGTQSCKINYTSGNGIAVLYPNPYAPVFLAGHKYYMSYMAKTSRALTGGEYFGLSLENAAWTTCWQGSTMTVNNTSWTRVSCITGAVPVSEWYAFNAMMFTTDTTLSGYIDSMIIVDLTEAFGSGKEPTQAWCDANLPIYFEGTATVSLRKIFLTPSGDLPAGIITVDLETYDGSVWSPKKTNTFTVNAVPTFSVQPTAPGIAKADIDNLETWLKNHKAFRGLSGTDEIVEALTANTTPVKKAHIDAFRTEIATLLSTLNITPTWTDPTIVAGTTTRKGTHWIEMFNYLKQV